MKAAEKASWDQSFGLEKIKNKSGQIMIRAFA
jgi:hypothetical protein